MIFNDVVVAARYRPGAALKSGAHFISTDYPVPNPDFSDYQVSIPGGGIARCNPVNPGDCRLDLLDEDAD